MSAPAAILGQPRARRSRRTTRPLTVESLEDRTVPSAGVDFLAAQTFASGGSGPVFVAVGDFNNDGNADLAAANYLSGSVGVLLGDGSGNFAAAVSFATGGSNPITISDPFAVAVGDFNNDGNDDLAVANYNSAGVSVLLGTGGGAFATAVPFASGGANPDALAVGDFNNDGNDDLAVANYLTNNVGLLLGNGSGGFATPVLFASGGTRPASLAVGDFNNDGNDDLAAANFGGNVGVLLGNGAGSFAPALSLATGGSFPSWVAVEDFNKHDNADLAVVNQGSNNVGLLLGNGSGSFATAVAYPTGGSLPDAVAIEDFNKDGNADLAVTHNSNSVGVLQGDGSGGFAAALTFAGGPPAPRAVVVGDFNNDGKSDLAMAQYGGHNVAVLRNSTITNQPPVNTVPGGQVAFEDVAKGISGLSVADDTAGTLTVTLTVAHGTLTVNNSVAGGLTTSNITGNGTASVTLTGTQAQINATLAAAAGLTYLGVPDYHGLDTLTMTTTDAGGLSDTDTVAIEVLNAQQQADLLAAIIADLGDDGVLNGGQENSLIQKLSFLSTLTGDNKVEAFINQVNAMISAGVLTQEEGDELIALAETIILSLQ